MKPLTRAAIIAVGSELLTPLRIDTNSLFITEQLNALGIDVVMKGVAGDDRDELAHLFRAALARADLVVFTGGLGPTDDDVTREAVAATLGRQMSEDAGDHRADARPVRGAWLQGPMPEINRRQAMVPAGAVVLENAAGKRTRSVAGGRRVALSCCCRDRRANCKPMLDALVDGPLTRSGGRRAARPARAEDCRANRVADRRGAAAAVSGVGAGRRRESARRSWPRSGRSSCIFRLGTSSAEIAGAALEGAVRQVCAVLGEDVFSTTGEPMEAVVGDLLVSRGYRIALAESCTGGLVTSRLTDVPGSSRYVDRAVVVYANEAKTDLLGVPAALIDAARRRQRAGRAWRWRKVCARVRRWMWASA